MPPVPASVNDMYQVRIKGLLEGQETNNILHFTCASSDTDVEEHLIKVLITCFVTHVLPVITSNWSCDSVIWKRVSPTLGPEFVTTDTFVGSGGGPGASLPSYCSVVLSIRTALGGRSHRGRMYLPGIPEAATFNSLLDMTNVFWLGVVAFVGCVITNFIIGDPPGLHAWQMGVYSRKIGGSAFPYGASGFTAITSINVVGQLGTTRSRKVGRGS